MSSPQPPFVDYSTLPPFPARPTTPPRRSAWLISFLVLGGVTLAGTVLGPIVFITAFHLSPLYPLNVLLGMTFGAAYGLGAGILAAGVTGVVLAAVRAEPAGSTGPATGRVSR